MVFAVISLGGDTGSPVWHGGNLTAMRYWTEILALYVTPYANGVATEFTVMDKNIRHHRARLAAEYREHLRL